MTPSLPVFFGFDSGDGAGAGSGVSFFLPPITPRTPRRGLFVCSVSLLSFGCCLGDGEGDGEGEGRAEPESESVSWSWATCTGGTLLSKSGDEVVDAVEATCCSAAGCGEGLFGGGLGLGLGSAPRPILPKPLEGFRDSGFLAGDAEFLDDGLDCSAGTCCFSLGGVSWRC